MAEWSRSQAALVTLEGGVDPAVARALKQVPGLTVIVEAPDSAVLTEGQTTSLRPQLTELGDISTLLEADGEPPLLLAVSGILDDETAARLEDAGVGYVDAAARSWLPGQRRSTRARVGRRASERVGSASVRAAQLLADDPDAAWTNRSLAEAAHVTSVTAHRLLRQLEMEGLLERHGRSRSTRRRVRDQRALWEWLGEHGRPSRARVLHAFASDLPAAVRAQPDRRLVLTGSAAAERMGLPVMSAVPQPLFRVDASDDELEDIPSALGGFRTASGANFAIVADPQRLAVDAARQVDDGLWLASPSRVMLDMYLEPRGAAAAEVFRDLWLRRRQADG
jgi:hypothetical protein